MRYIVRLPDVGEGIHEADVVSYEVQVGDRVKLYECCLGWEEDRRLDLGRQVDDPEPPILT